jgi:hypothetical protein
MLRVASLIALCALRMFALPALTTIQDTIYQADGTPMNGTVIIAWPSFIASDGTKIAAQTLVVPVTSGYFQVSLVPTAGASPATAYSVRINSAGMNQSTELWSVPASATPLTIANVMIVQTGGVIIGSNPVIAAPTDTTSIPITDVVGLSNELAVRPMMGTTFADSRAAVIDATGAVDGAAGNLSDCVHVDGTSGGCGSGATNIFVDGEVPSGAINGSNVQFTLANTPVASSSVSAWRNGLFLHFGVDFSVSGNTITFLGTAPQTGDVVLASYRTGTLSGVTFVDAETPSGTANGSNATFTLANTPNPAGSVAVYRNGLRVALNIDYTLAGSTITFLPVALPQSGDTLVASYRH